MLSSNNKWLIHTILIGLIPVLTRLLTWAATATGRVAPIAAADFITLGLIVHVSILNETEHLLLHDPALKALLNSASIIIVTFYGTLYGLVSLGEHNPELINQPFVLPSCILLCIASVLFGLQLFQISKRRQK